VQADRIRKVINEVRASSHLKATIVRVTAGDQETITEAFGDSMTGVPATTDMHFRNGAVAISYVATLLLQLVDEKS
jgi:CubicO group peptidase (beta-lactamase class C family)